MKNWQGANEEGQRSGRGPGRRDEKLAGGWEEARRTGRGRGGGTNIWEGAGEEGQRTGRVPGEEGDKDLGEGRGRQTKI